MKVLVSGSHGLIGSALVQALEARGDTVTRLVRGAGGGGVRWDPAGGTIDREGLEGHDAVVHLAGETIFGLWTSKKRRAIRDSRVDGTRLLAASLAGLQSPPRVLVSGSAVGYYGDAGATELTESSPPGSTFLASVCREWEAATLDAEQAGIRVVHSRTGIVQSRQGGALKVTLLPFRMGVGGKLGNGRQWFSWITLDDMVRALLFCIDTEAVSGPVNVTAPEPVTNAHYTRALGAAVRRPTLLPAPAPALRLAMRGLADELLGSLRVVPTVLQQHGFEFNHPTIEAALAHELGRLAPAPAA